MESGALRLGGDLTIANAMSVRQKMMDWMESQEGGQELSQVVVADDAEIDLSLIQLLVSLWKSAREKGVALQLAMPAPEMVERSLRLVGLLQPNEQQIDSDRMGKVR